MANTQIICSICGLTEDKSFRLPQGWEERTITITTPGDKAKGIKSSTFMQGSLYRCPEHQWLRGEE